MNHDLCKDIEIFGSVSEKETETDRPIIWNYSKFWFSRLWLIRSELSSENIFDLVVIKEKKQRNSSKTLIYKWFEFCQNSETTNQNDSRDTKMVRRFAILTNSKCSNFVKLSKRMHIRPHDKSSFEWILSNFIDGPVLRYGLWLILAFMFIKEVGTPVKKVLEKHCFSCMGDVYWSEFCLVYSWA